MDLTRMQLLRNLVFCLVATLLSGCGDSHESPDPGKTSVDSALTASANAPDSAQIPKIVPDEERGFETPEAAWQATIDAKQKNDPAAHMAAHTVWSQTAVAGGMIFGLGMMGALDEGLREDVTAIFARHGLSDQNSLQKPPPGITEESSRIEQMHAMGSVFPNPAAFVIDATTFIDAQPNSNSRSKPPGELGEVTIDGNVASADLRYRRGRKRVEFRKTSGGWLVQLTNDHFESFSGKTVSGSGKVDRFGMRDRDLPPLPPVEATTLDAIQTAWQISVDYQNLPAIEALRDVTRKCGLSIFDQPQLADTLNQTVNVTMSDVSSVQVIEEICTQVKLHPRYKAGAVAFSRGPRALPITFAGPFIVEATETQELVPSAFGKVKFQCFAAALPTEVTSRLSGLYVQTTDDVGKCTLHIPQLHGIDDSELPTKFRSFFPIRASNSTVQIAGEVDVANLLQAVTEIAEFDGRLSWSFPREIETVVLKQIEADVTKTAGDATLSVTQANVSARSTSLSLTLDGVTHKELLVSAIDSTGMAIEGAFVSGYSDKANIQIQGEAAEVQISVIKASDRISFPFRFPAIPLSHHADMPMVLPELAFEGDLPVSIELARFSEQNNTTTAKFRWTNNTNKDIHSIKMNVAYLGADGTVLQKRDQLPSGNRILLEYQESEETSIFGHSVPDGAKSARVVLKSIEFVDGTIWESQ